MSTSSRAALRCAEATTTSYYDQQAASFDHIPFGPRLLPELLRSCLPSTAIGADGRMEHGHGRIGGDDDGDGYGDGDRPKMELTALDVGSGPGALAAWLRDEMCYTVECVDPSRAMAERCCAKGLRAHQCPIQDYVPSHEEQAFDVILAVSSLFHIPKDDLASNVVPKLTRLLKTHGCLVVSLMVGDDTAGLLDPTSSGTPRFFSGVQPAELLGWLGPAFSIRHEQRTPVPAMRADFWIAVLVKEHGHGKEQDDEA